MHTKISGGATVNLKVYQIAKEISERKKKTEKIMKMKSRGRRKK